MKRIFYIGIGKSFQMVRLSTMVIWKLDRPDPDRSHGFKYRLFYGRKGQRIVGYDNEKGKGDHRHYRGREEPYVFTTVGRLIEDFNADVKKEEQL